MPRERNPSLPYRGRAMLRSIGPLIGLLGGIACQGEVGVTAPVKDFRLPVFNPAGQRTWDLRGGEGFRSEAGTVELRDMWLRFFETEPAADGRPAVVVEIRSPVASVRERDKIASGSDRILITGPAYRIEGSRWEFDGSGVERRVVIRENVRVVFEERLDAILK